MNLTLYKNGIKGSWKLWFIILAVMVMYMSVVISMFDPSLGNLLEELSTSMPEIMALFGMRQSGAELVDFMASYLYGMIFLIFPMVFTIITANRLIAKHVDGGSMAYLLAAPVSRTSIVFTQLLVLLSGTSLLIIASAGLGAVAAQIMFPGELDIPAYILLNLGVLFLHLFIAGICFFSSCLFNDTKWSITLGAGLPVLCYVLQMAATLGGNFEGVKYLTFFTLFSPNAIIHNESWSFIAMVVLLVAALLLYGATFIIFSHKDIPV